MDFKEVSKVFVSGSAIELEPEREITARTIRALYMEPIFQEGIIPADVPLGHEELLEDVNACDFFVLLLWRTLPPQVKWEYEAAVTQHRSLIVCVKMLKGGEEREPALTDFLRNLNLQASQSQAPSVQVKVYRDFRTLADLESVLEDAITAEVRRQLRHKVITAATRAEMYRLGARIAVSARHRLYVVQKSAILLVGARPYRAKSKDYYEQEYLSALDSWIHSCISDPVRSFVYLYDIEGTRREIESNTLQNAALDNLQRYKELEQKTGRRFTLASMTTRHPPGPMTVGDDWFAFWVMGAQDAITISFTNHSVCEEVINVLGPLAGNERELESQANELGLDCP